MQKTKKIFSALLAIVMLVSVFTFTTSAGAPVPSGSAKVSIAYEVVNADGDVITTVAPGETVTVNVYANAAAASDTLTEFKISVFFDSNVFVKDDTAIKSSLQWLGLASWVSTAGSTFDVYQAGNTYFDAIVAKATTEELENGWDTMAYCVGVASGDEDYLVQENADTAMYSFDLKVADNVAAGTSANVGCYAAASYISRTKSYCYIKTPSTGSRIADGAVDMPETQVVEVKPAETPFPTETIVEPLKGQIRFHKDDNGAYANSFDVRALAVISGDDFTATFTDEATAKEMIKEIGFVFAAGSNVASPSFDAVQGLVENDTAAEGYTKKTVEFIARNHDFNGDVADYAFSCVVTDIPDADKGNSLVAVGYIAYEVEGVMTYAYYPAAQTVSYTELFDAHYDSAFPA